MKHYIKYIVNIKFFGIKNNAKRTGFEVVLSSSNVPKLDPVVLKHILFDIFQHIDMIRGLHVIQHNHLCYC